MINGAKISYEIPDVDVSPSVDVVETSIGQSDVVRSDLALQANLACKVVTSTQTRGSIRSKMAKVTRHYVSTNPTLMTETPYEVSAHLVVRSDERYATLEDQQQVIGALLSFLLEKADGTTRNVVRLALGEL
jgi:hypothetical protein